VDVNKRLTIRSENGADVTIVQAANLGDFVFYITSDYVNLSGFSIKGAAAESYRNPYTAGIYLWNARHCNISYNYVLNNMEDGICLYHFSSDNVIMRNTVDFNSDDGIVLDESSSNNIIMNNSVGSNGGTGIVIEDSSNNNYITNNKVSFNYYGIFLKNSDYNTIWFNNFSDNSVYQAGDNNGEDNLWDNGSLGNYWGDYTEKYPTASNISGIWDTPYQIGGSSGSEDRYPLVSNIFPNGIEILKFKIYAHELSSRWMHNPISSLPLYKTIIEYNISNLEKEIAEEVEIVIKIDGEIIERKILDSLNGGDNYINQFILKIEYDTSKTVQIIVSDAVCTESYNFVINAILPRRPQGFQMETIYIGRVFITPNDPIVDSTLNDILNSYPSTMPDWMAIRDWVGYFINYVNDSDEYGVDEYWQLPRETINKRSGDCEDISILLVSLLRANGWAPDETYVVIGYKIEDGEEKWHAWVRIKIGSLWYNIEPQADVLYTLVGDYLVLNDFNAVYMFNDLQCEKIGLVIRALCPIDIIIKDPDGLIIRKEINEIINATYDEFDLNGDESIDDQIRIPNIKIGDYLITVIPEQNATPTDTFSLEIILDDKIIILAQDVLISNIPSEPYVIKSTSTGIVWEKSQDKDKTEETQIINGYELFIFLSSIIGVGLATIILKKKKLEI